MNFKQFLFFLFFFSVIAKTQSQEKEFINAPLKKVLLLLEKKHDVKFSFQDKIVTGKKITINLSTLNFSKTLEQLQLKSNLYFQKITKRYIIVSEKSSANKTTACGYVVDLITEQPLLGAVIFTTDNIIGTTTNKNGYFQLSGIKEKDSIKIALQGYQTTIKPITHFLKSPCTIIDLKEQSSWLKEVLINNYLTDGIVKDTDGSVVVSPKKLGILPGLTEPDILQSIQLLPGINSPNETASGIHIRGGTPDQNLILFDGIKMYNSAHFLGMISAFNPYITKNVKVYKKGASAKYGNHVSGVIDIETDDEIAKVFYGGFGTNLTHSDAYVKIPISKKIGVSISARKSFTGLIETTTFNKFSKKVFQNSIITRNNEADATFFNSDNKFTFSDVNAKIVANISNKNRVQFNFLFSKNELDYQFKSINGRYKTGDLLKIKNSGFRVKWRYKLSNKSVLNTSFYKSKYDYDYAYKGVFIFNTVINQSAIKKNKIDDFNVNTTLKTVINNNNKLLFGYEYSNNNVLYNLQRSYSDAPSFNYQINKDAKNNTHALFGEYIYKTDKKTAIHFGLRANHFSLTKKTFFAPRVYAQTKLNALILLKTSLEYKQQNISQLVEFDTSDFGLENQVWVLAENEKVPVLKSDQITLGFVFNKDNWTVDLDFYKKNITGLTSFTNGFVSLNSSNLIGKGSTNGIDFLIKKKWKNYNTWISYSLSNSKNTFEVLNNNQSFAANFDTKHNFLWSHNLKIGNYNFSLGWSKRTGIPYTPAIGLNSSDEIVYGTINSKRLPNYEKVDFSSTYSFSFDKEEKIKGKLGVSLLNIANKKNILKRSYETSLNNNTNLYELKEVNNISLGFTPNLVFRVDF